ncbi:MAG: P-loop NTPase [Bacteroidetes bacterium]|jgi:flagellar biosynthesis protein FlhG|nr:P-loop NTPase [Bacteroidota bacterium]
MKRTSTTLTIASGKGGVGKSVVAVNLAETLTRRGHSVALLDADVGQGACSVLLNEDPPHTVADLVRLDAAPDAVCHETTAGVTLIQSARAPDAFVTEQQATVLHLSLDEMLRTAQRHHDFVLIDTPAGTGGTVRWALDRADLGALVLVGEPTAIADAYRLAKLIWRTDPTFPLGSIVNFAETAEDANSIATRFATITERFVHQAPTHLGWIPFMKAVRTSVQTQTPAVRSVPAVQEAFDALAGVVAEGRHHERQPINTP